MFGVDGYVLVIMMYFYCFGVGGGVGLFIVVDSVCLFDCWGCVFFGDLIGWNGRDCCILL